VRELLARIFSSDIIAMLSSVLAWLLALILVSASDQHQISIRSASDQHQISIRSNRTKVAFSSLKAK
jgi:hypothetical protein